MTGAAEPSIAAVDALVARVDPGVSSPGVDSRDVVLVTGPWLAGTTSLIAALRDRISEHTFVEADELGPADAPAAVVFVVSAVAPLTESDCALVDLAANHTDVVVGVVSKTDMHRKWRDVLAADGALLAARAPRYQDVAWVGAAAAPELGEPNLDELVDLLRQRLGHADGTRRNRLRAWETRLQTLIARHQAEGAGSDREARVAALRQRRDDILRERRQSKSERTIALRSQIQQARVQLAYFARNRCTSVRAALQQRGIDPGLLTPLPVTGHPLSSPVKAAGNAFLSFFLPYILITMIITGGFSAALDTSAGERERRTLESLLLTPAPRSRLLLGKIGAITTISLMAAVAAIGSMFLALSQISTPGAGGSSLHISLNPAALPVMVWLALLIAVSFSAVTLAIGTLAKSFRQGQAYVTPLYFVTILPASIILFIPDFNPTLAYYLIPILNAVLVLRDAIVHNSVGWAAIAVTTVSLIATGALSWYVALRLFTREALLTKS